MSEERTTMEVTEGTTINSNEEVTPNELMVEERTNKLGGIIVAGLAITIVGVPFYKYIVKPVVKNFKELHGKNTNDIKTTEVETQDVETVIPEVIEVQLASESPIVKKSNKKSK